MSTLMGFITGAWGLGAIGAAVAVLVLVGIVGRVVPFWVWLCVIAALAVAIFAQRAVTADVRIELARANEAAALEQAAHQATRAAHATQLQRLAALTLRTQQAVAALNAENTQKESESDQRHIAQLKSRQQEIDRLRRLARSSPDAVSVRVIGATCQPADPARSADLPAGTEHAPAGSVGDGAVTLQGDALEAALDHLESVEQDAAALSYLQDYARMCATRATPPAQSSLGLRLPTTGN